jgi:hypothetical protein
MEQGRARESAAAAQTPLTCMSPNGTPDSNSSALDTAETDAEEQAYEGGGEENVYYPPSDLDEPPYPHADEEVLRNALYNGPDPAALELPDTRSDQMHAQHATAPQCVSSPRTFVPDDVQTQDLELQPSFYAECTSPARSSALISEKEEEDERPVRMHEMYGVLKARQELLDAKAAVVGASSGVRTGSDLNSSQTHRSMSLKPSTRSADSRKMPSASTTGLRVARMPRVSALYLSCVYCVA